METLPLTTALSLILVLGLATQWLSSIFKVPSILLLLVAGVIAGPVLEIIQPEKVLGDLLVPITTLSIAIILFEGGVSLRFRDIKEVGHVIRNVVTFGAAAGAAATFCFLYFVLNFSLIFSVLESAVLMITGPTVITPMLNELHIKQPVRSILKWEGIITDPIGALTAVLIFEGVVFSSEHAMLETLGIGALQALAVGLLLGGAGAVILLYALRRFWIPDMLHSPVTLMFLILVFTASNMIQSDSGLLSATVMGIVLANQKKTTIAHIIDFKESLTVILITFLFISLAGTMDLEQIQDTALVSTALLVFLIFVARPLSVLLSGAFTTIPVRQALFMCCLAPRGIVTAVIASLFGFELTKAGYADAEYFVPVTFAMIAGTVTFYSICTPIAARLLRVAAQEEMGILIIGANALARAVGRALRDAGSEVQLIDPNYWKVAETRRSILPVYRGTFLSFEEEHPEKFDEMSMMLAMTENDDINSLAVIHMRSHFDESELYQLPTNTKKIKESLMGQQLFSDQFDYHTLSALLEEGYEIKATSLSPEFTYKHWKEQYSEQKAALLFYIRPSGVVVPRTKDMDLSPWSKGRIIFMCKKDSPF